MSALPNPATLQYFDNTNAVPAPYGVSVPFNNEQQDVWLGYDGSTGKLCITNFSRTIVLACYSAGGDPSFYPNQFAFAGSFIQGSPAIQNQSISVDRSGYNDIINIKAAGLPSGLSIADFSIPDTTNNVVCTLAYDGTTVAGTYPFVLNYYKNGSVVIHRQTNSSVNISPPEVGPPGGGGGPLD